MAVYLSPVGGVAAQFFDNNGTPLAGGLIYTYAAGTSTPATTYTSSSGLVAHSNPIVLDASGRVPTGEIWLSDALAYKFVIQTSGAVLIASYDNISGINSNFIAYTAQQEIQTATAGQTVFTLTTMQYKPGANNLSVFVDGVNQYGSGAQYAYVETDETTITFVSGLHVGASVKFTTTTSVAGAVANAENVTYDPPFTGSVPTNAEAKFAQTVSVKDFGAIGNGVVDDTIAIQTALNYGIQTGIPPATTPFYQNRLTVYIPEGIYNITSELILPAGVSIEMDTAAVIIATSFMNSMISTEEVNYLSLQCGTRINGGQLNCNHLANIGIWPKYFAYFTISNIQIWNAELAYVKLGSNTAPASSYEAMITDSIFRRDLTPHPTNNVGIQFERCGDSHIENLIIMGVAKGISGTVYDSKFSKVHVWNPYPISGYSNTDANVALSVGFETGGEQNIYNQCQVDGPLVVGGSGWYFTKQGNSLIGCSVNAAACQDLGNQAVYLDTGAYTSIIGCTFKGGSPTSRLALAVTGPGAKGSEIFGNDSSVNVATKQLDNAPSLSKAWIVFSSSGGTINVLKSYNVSSVTYTAVGKYTVNFLQSMADVNYAATFGGTTDGLPDNPILIYGGARLTTSLKIFALDAVTNNFADGSYINVDIKQGA